jgi:hypothetical protein
MSEISREEMAEELGVSFSFFYEIFLLLDSWPRIPQRAGRSDQKKKNIEIEQAILDLIESSDKGPEVDEACDCDDYKWLRGELKWIYGLTIENRGPFKFCPYCGKRIKEEK